MAKPIFLVGLPSGAIAEMIEHAQKTLTGSMPDYHILVYRGHGNDAKFQCFYEKDIDEIKFEELKQMVSEQLKK